MIQNQSPFNVVLESILDPLKGSLTILFTHQAQKVLEMRECIGKYPSPTSTRDRGKIDYISKRQPSSYELAFRLNPSLQKYPKFCFSKTEILGKILLSNILLGVTKHDLKLILLLNILLEQSHQKFKHTQFVVFLTKIYSG